MRYKSYSRYSGIDMTDRQQCYLQNLNLNYNTVVVQSNEKDRLDLVSLRVYNDPSYWWLIALYSNIINPMFVEVGRVLRAPIIEGDL